MKVENLFGSNLKSLAQAITRKGAKPHDVAIRGEKQDCHVASLLAMTWLAGFRFGRN
jgi:hypothetical protein